MATPLRRVKEMDDCFFGNSSFFSGPLSAIQKELLGTDVQQRVIKLQPISKIDVRDSELLHQIWISNGTRTASTKENDTYEVPSSITEYDLIRLKTSGLVVGKGRNVEFTESGNKIVKKKILESASTFDLDRTREKYDPKSVEK